jgi:hypothetical protein
MIGGIMKMLRMAFLIPILGLLTLASCQWNSSSKTSVLVIAVEGLGFSSVSCRSDELSETSSGFQVLCGEALRFTHAYTPSTQTTAALASTLTGEYPIAHGLRHNGHQFLSATANSAAERALRNNYATGFFSGGPPVFFKSGLAQGFQAFDDSFPVLRGEPHRPAKETFGSVLQWLRQVPHPFFATVFIPDLQFKDALTTSESGVPRDLSAQSQLEAVDEALGFLFRELKKQKRWEKTHIFVFGTNGRNRNDRYTDIPGTSLHGDATHITFFAKPAGASRDLGLSWKVDANVSLVDLGRTLNEMVASDREVLPASRHQQVSLASALDGHDFNVADDRPIFLESAWPQWRAVGMIRHAVRIGEYLVVLDDEPLVFNSLLDRMENNPIWDLSGRAREVLEFAQNQTQGLGVKPWVSPNLMVLKKLALAGELWFKSRPRFELRQILEARAKENPEDFQLQQWLAELYAEKELWPQLLALGRRTETTTWMYVADQYLEKKAPIPDDPCWVFLKSPLKGDLGGDWNRGCDDEMVVSFVTWVYGQDESSRDRGRDKLVRDLRAAVLDRRFNRLNYVTGLMWDTKFMASSHTTRIEQILQLPQFRRQREIVARRIETGQVPTE